MKSKKISKIIDHYTRYPWESYAWQGHNEFYKPCKFITERMTFSRFQQLKMSISFDDEFLTKYINFKFRDLWNVGLILTVDETLFPFKGRYRYKQHIKGKPDSTGLKIFLLCDDSGYCYSFFMYKGSNVGRRTCVKGIVMEFLEDVLKDNTKPIYKKPGVIDEDEDEDEDADLLENYSEDLPAKRLERTFSDTDDSEEDETYTLTQDDIDEMRRDVEEENAFIEKEIAEPTDEIEKIEKRLVELRKNNNNQFLIVGDSYYGCFALTEILDRLDVYSIFAVSGKRDKTIKDRLINDLLKREVRNLFHTEKNITFCCWFDTAKISFVSNFASGKYSFSKSQAAQYPIIAFFYNKFMNLVDHFDLYLKAFWNNHRKRKWKTTYFYGLIKMISVNSFTSFASKTKSHETYIQFLVNLLNSYKKDDDIASTISAIPHLIFKDFYKFATASVEGRRKSCAECTRKKKYGMSTGFFCSACLEPVHKKCFKEHSCYLNSQK